MKISLRELKAIIREVSMSPSLSKNNAAKDSPLDYDDIKKSLGDVKRGFTKSLIMNLVLLSMKQHYDPSTKEFNDAAYERITSIANNATSVVVDDVMNSLNRAWASAHGELKKK